MTKPSILIMAGGTGGHIFPGLAVAEYLRICGWKVFWLGNQSGMEYRLVKACDFPFEAVEFSGLRGKGIKAKLMLPFNLAKASFQSLKIMRRIKPNVVLGMGGYITFPGGLMTKFLKKPLVFGAIYQHEGQVSVFNQGPGSCNYRDLYPQQPTAEEIPNCAETGVLGVLPGIIGSLMALEVIKVLSGLGKPLANKVLYFNSLNSQSYEVEIQPSAGSAVPTSWSEFEQRKYDLATEGIAQLTWNEAMKLMGQEVAFVDVRELGEMPPLVCTGLVKVPYSILSSQLDQFEEAEEILCFCQTGARSQKAAQLLQHTYPDKKIFSIRGGIQALKS